jgi:hypothetical protein
LIYATEDKAYIRLAAKDVQKFLSTTNEDDLIDGTFAPYPYFFNHYFFLEKRSWTFGSRWDEQEAEKHLRILNTMLKLNIIDKKVAKILNPKRE